MTSLKFIPLLAFLAAAPAPKPLVSPDTDAAFPPHRIAGNLYYVGSRDISSYLITTSKGHILINSGFAKTVPLIKASVEKLGFKFSDVNILLCSHAHDDHVAGTAAVRRLTGARVMVMEGDEQIVRTGGTGDFQYNSKWEPSELDAVLKDRQKVSLGGTTLTAYKTAGHTRGCTTWVFDVPDRKVLFRAVIIGSPNVNPGYQLVGNMKYPRIATDYTRTFKTLKSLRCDLFLGAHGSYYGLEGKYERLKKGENNPFIDPKGYQAYVEERRQAFERELAKQKAAPSSERPAPGTPARSG
jgi:metallo-beta-lactamase class B